MHTAVFGLPSNRFSRIFSERGGGVERSITSLWDFSDARVTRGPIYFASLVERNHKATGMTTSRAEEREKFPPASENGLRLLKQSDNKDCRRNSASAGYLFMLEPRRYYETKFLYQSFRSFEIRGLYYSIKLRTCLHSAIFASNSTARGIYLYFNIR